MRHLDIDESLTDCNAMRSLCLVVERMHNGPVAVNGCGDDVNEGTERKCGAHNERPHALQTADCDVEGAINQYWSIECTLHEITHRHRDDVLV